MNFLAKIKSMSRRLNTQLQATGAEFLVLGNLLIRGIQAYKAYANYPGYDLVAVNPENNRCCRIQVKSRYAIGADSFPIRNFDCDVVVFVALNQGDQCSQPTLYVFPIEIIEAAQQIATDAWHKVYLRTIPDIEQYQNAWHYVTEGLVSAAI